MKLIVLTCLVAVACGAVVDKCAWGESYWCSSITVANKCGAFNHCMDTVWPNQKIEKESTDVCTFCEDIIKDVRALVDDKKNQEEIKTFLDNACNIIPDEALANMCKTTVNEEFDELIKMIDSQLDPATVCSAMGLCSGLKDTVKHSPIETNSVLEAAPAPPNPEPVCADCKKFMTDIKNLITDKTTEDEFEQMLEQQLCSQMGELEDMCKTLVKTYTPEIFQMLAQSIEPNMICQALGFCEATQASKSLMARIRLSLSPLAKAAKVGDETQCLLCKTVIGEVRDMSRDKTTQQEVENFVKKNLCGLLGSLEKECEETVDQYGPELFELLVDELDPEARCQSLGFCQAAVNTQALLRLASPKQALEHKAQPIKPGQVMAGKAVSAGEQCVVCELVVKEVDSLIADNATEKEILKTLDEVCAILPSAIKDTCTQFVDTYGPLVLNLLLKELTPDQVCAAIGLCDSTKTPLTAPSTKCVLCEFVIKELDSLLGDNATEKEIIQAVDEVCSELPDTIKETCNTFVNQYGPPVIALLLQELDPQQVCTAIKLCSSSVKKSETLTFKPVKVKASAQCTLCEFVMQELDSLLKDNATEQEILDDLDKVCSIMPKSIKKDCTDFVNTYGRVVINLLAQELKPSVVCAAMGLCPGKVLLKKQLLMSTPKKVSASDPELCGVCETVIQYVDSLLEEKATIEEIEQVLDKVCNFLPDNIKQQCDDLVKQYGPDIIKMIAEVMDPKEICTTIGLCSNATAQNKPNGMVKLIPAKQHLLGDQQCTYGPAYWCETLENAKKCGMVDHCNKHGWKKINN